MKKALVIRLGAFGDLVMITPVLRALKRDGYHVTLNCKAYSKCVLDNNPNIDKFIVFDEDTKDLEAYWASISIGFDRVINLSESIEGSLLKVVGREDFHDTKGLDDINYWDRTMELSGYPDSKGERGELFFTRMERHTVRKLLDKYEGRYKVLWALSGSSVHKSYYYAQDVCDEFLSKYRDAVVFTVGDAISKVLEWKHPQVVNLSDRLNLRIAMLMCDHVNLVVSPETGIAAAAGTFDTPSVILLSHSTHNNLCKYYANHTCLHSDDAPCYPCHQIHSSVDSCVQHKYLGPVCMATLNPNKVLKAMEGYYDGAFRRERQRYPVC